MAIGWLGALKALPWKDMIDYAPTVVSGAQKLWQHVRKKEAEPETPEQAGPKSPEAAIAELEQQVGELHARQRELSALVKELADQNQRLVQAVEVLRVRTRLLLAGFLVLAIAALVYWRY